MDTSTVALTKNTSAQVGKRRMRTLEEKRQIVEEVLRSGESVAVIARRHEVNANLVFSWMDDPLWTTIELFRLQRPARMR